MKLVKLPEEYIIRMKEMLGTEYDAYIKTLEAKRNSGLRVNTLKIEAQEFEKISPFKLEKVEWADEGYYYDDNEAPGKHAFYHAGLYYMQEPSAMYPAEVLEAEPGQKILDVCAAPGGKSVQIASKLRSKGILVTNDINENRVKALVKNIELQGVRNAIITNETTQKLKQKFNKYFDKILVDAPCSGEGMFGKDETAVKSWLSFSPEKCREMQDVILEDIHHMLKSGGEIVYSTCTFNAIENEQTIADFMKRHKEYKLVDIKKSSGISDGKPEWANGNIELSKAARLWPQRIRGEGHFTAKLINTLESKDKPQDNSISKSYKVLSGVPDEVREFYKRNMKHEPWEGYYILVGSRIYYLPIMPPNIDGLKFEHIGLYMGEISEHKRFKPSHPFFLANEKDSFINNLDLQADDFDVQRYLKGETIMCGVTNGLTVVRVNGYILGCGIVDNGVMKNLYPKGWRRMN